MDILLSISLITVFEVNIITFDVSHEGKWNCGLNSPVLQVLAKKPMASKPCTDVEVNMAKRPCIKLHEKSHGQQ